MVSTACISDPEAAFMMAAERECLADTRLSLLGGGILAALDLDIAQDSRRFARALGIEHAIVLRELAGLADLNCIVIARRDERTSRCHYLRC